MSFRTVFRRQLIFNYNVLHRQTEGLTHDESLLQPPFRGNSLNWVLGHIIRHRNLMLEALGRESLWTAGEDAMYGTDSEPITGPDSPHISFDRLLDDLTHTQDLLLEIAEIMTDEELAAPYNERFSIQERIVFLSWHEAYHAGQTELLRQLAGKDDKII